MGDVRVKDTWTRETAEESSNTVPILVCSLQNSREIHVQVNIGIYLYIWWRWLSHRAFEDHSSDFTLTSCLFPALFRCQVESVRARVAGYRRWYRCRPHPPAVRAVRGCWAEVLALARSPRSDLPTSAASSPLPDPVRDSTADRVCPCGRTSDCDRCAPDVGSETSAIRRRRPGRGTCRPDIRCTRVRDTSNRNWRPAAGGRPFSGRVASRQVAGRRRSEEPPDGAASSSCNGWCHFRRRYSDFRNASVMSGSNICRELPDLAAHTRRIPQRFVTPAETRAQSVWNGMKYQYKHLSKIILFLYFEIWLRINILLH